MATKATLFKPTVIGGFVQRGHRARNKRPRRLKPELTIAQVLAWADAYHERTGRWPHALVGPVHEQPSETWNGIQSALIGGFRGFRGGTTLAQVLLKHRGARNPSDLPRLTIGKVLAWADAHHKRTGRWPNLRSGPVEGSGGESWQRIGVALRHGLRGLPGGWTLGRLLQRHRHARDRLNRPPLTIGMVLKWADAHCCRTGKWPKVNSGPVPESPGDTWRAIDYALCARRSWSAGGTHLIPIPDQVSGWPRVKWAQ